MANNRAKSPTAAFQTLTAPEDAFPEVPPTKTQLGYPPLGQSQIPTFGATLAGEAFTMIPVPVSAVARLGPDGAEKVLKAIMGYLDRGFACDDPSAIVIQTDQRRELTRLLGRNFTSPDDVLSAVRALSSVTAGDVHIPLSVELLARIKTRCHNQHREPEVAQKAREEVVIREVTWALERFTNLR